MDQQAADGMKLSVSLVVIGSQLSYKEGGKSIEKSRMRNRTESELNEKTYGQTHYKEFFKKSNPYKISVKIAARCSQW